jgi:hypothetical protein
MFRRGQGSAAVRGALASTLVIPGGLRARWTIQRSRRVRGAALGELLLPSLPPNMRVLRGTRDRLRRLIGLRVAAGRADG